MADYAPTTWVEGQTKVGPTRMNAIEQALADAAAHNATGAGVAARPPADAAHKNWFWTDQLTGRMYYCDGTQWIATSPRTTPKAQAARAPSQFPSASGGGFAGDATHPAAAQQFTAAVSGEAGLVTVAVARGATTVTQGVLTAYLYTDNNGAPGNVIGTSENELVASLPLSGFATVTLRMTAQLVAGQKYWFAIAATNTNGAMTYEYEQDSGGGFPQALHTTGNPATSTWNAATTGPSMLFGVYTVTGGLRATADPSGADLLRLDDQSGTALVTVDAAGNLVGADRWHYVGAPGEPAFQNGWVNYSTTSYPTRPALAYKRTLDNFLELRGYLSSNAATAPLIFALPAAYRPRFDTTFPCMSWLSPSWAAARLVVASSGNVSGFGSADTVPSGRNDFIVSGRVPLD